MRAHLVRAVARRAVRNAFFIPLAALGATATIARWFRRATDPIQVARVLVVRLDLLGDVLLTTPAVQALRAAYPRAHITMLTLPYTAPLARLYSEIDEVVAVDTNLIRRPGALLNPLTWSGYWQAWRRLRTSRFDLCLSVYGRMASLCSFLVGARRSVAYGAEAYPGLVTDAAPGGRYRGREHEVEYVRRLAEYAGTGSAPSSLRLPIAGESRSAAVRLLASRGVAEADRVVMVHAGSINGSAKRWPAASWAQFSDRMQELGAGRVVLVGAASDAEIARQVQAQARHPITSLVGATDIPVLAGVIERASLVASGDSGPLHMAVALGRPVLAVYGPTDPRISGPYHPRAPTRVLRHDLPCSPCYTLADSAECPLGDPICMRLVTVDQMVDAAMELLDASPAAPQSRGGS